ncbi:hypothetical protein K280104A7_20820 [Candidatus Bariatricus faecipullorum]
MIQQKCINSDFGTKIVKIRHKKTNDGKNDNIRKKLPGRRKTEDFVDRGTPVPYNVVKREESG